MYARRSWLVRDRADADVRPTSGGLPSWLGGRSARPKLRKPSLVLRILPYPQTEGRTSPLGQEKLKRIDQLLNDLSILSFEIDDEPERKAFRRAIATLCLNVHEQITLVAVKEFPDLHPDNGGMQDEPKSESG